MNKYVLLFGLMLSLATVNARHYPGRVEERELESEITEESARKSREHAPAENKHRRRRWQANYGYNYPPPPNPYYADERRDYDRNQDLLPQILRLLDEISAYVKRPPPPPPPQPIYVPYPVPYPVPQYCDCRSRPTSNTTGLSFPPRLPEMEDVRQNWGLEVNNNADDYNDGDGSRPLSFDPLTPPRAVARPVPKGETSKQKPNQSRVSSAPRTCEAAIITCCRPRDSREQQKSCFTDLGCAMTFDNGSVCNRNNIQSVLDAFSEAYSPVSNN